MKETKTKNIVCFTVPVGKPRQSRRDKWAQRPCVLRYRAFADALRLAAGEIPEDVYGLSVSAWLPIPKSWSKKKRLAMMDTPHQQTPDIDNIVKSVADSLFKQDSAIWFMSGEKFWETGDGPKLEITLTYGEIEP